MQQKLFKLFIRRVINIGILNPKDNIDHGFFLGYSFDSC